MSALGLVEAREGNLSTWDGDRLRITRTGSRLGDLDETDVIDGTLGEPPAEASSDLERHVWLYREQKARAVVHCHPAGTVPSGWREGEPHGLFTHGLTLEDALASALHLVEQGDLGPPRAGLGSARLPRAVEFEDSRPLKHRRGSEAERVFPYGALRAVDQTVLPSEQRELLLGTPEEISAAIRRLAVRGAPLLGIAAAFALVLAARASERSGREDALLSLDACGRMLIVTRPTAVNIRWAVERVLARARRADGDARSVAEAVLLEARAVEAEDADACAAIGRFGLDLIPNGARALTHCNTGMLCTAGIGTAFGILFLAHAAGRGIRVWVDETRPLLQGARLTAWELQRLGVPHTVIADSAAGSLMGADEVDLVITGADRIAANGDVANKIGTYALAVLARHHDIPFYVAAPTSTIDLDTRTGADIRIEQRDPDEVGAPFGRRVVPEGVDVANPAFDVTPAELVTAIVTERGVLRPPYAEPLIAASSAVDRGAA